VFKRQKKKIPTKGIAKRQATLRKEWIYCRFAVTLGLCPLRGNEEPMDRTVPGT